MTRGARSLLAFLRFRGGRLGQCYWRQSRIAEELGCHRSSIVRWVAELVSSGDLDSIRRGSTSNLYTLRKNCSKQRQFDFENATSDVACCDIASPAYKSLGSFKKPQSRAAAADEAKLHAENSEAAPVKPPQDNAYRQEFTQACAFGVPFRQWAEPLASEIVRAAAASGLSASAAGLLFAEVVRQPRFRDKSHSYVLAALRGEFGNHGKLERDRQVNVTTKPLPSEEERIASGGHSRRETTANRCGAERRPAIELQKCPPPAIPPAPARKPPGSEEWFSSFADHIAAIAFGKTISSKTFATRAP